MSRCSGLKLAELIPRFVLLPDLDVFNRHGDRRFQPRDRPAAAQSEIGQDIHWLAVFCRGGNGPIFPPVEVKPRGLRGDEHTEPVKAG